MNRKVLLVDDSHTLLYASRLVLESCGYEVCVLADGSGALPVILAERPQLILLDATMPPPGGTTLCRLIKSRTFRLRFLEATVLLHSSATEAELRDMVRDCGADGYLSKGWSWESRLEAIRAFLP